MDAGGRCSRAQHSGLTSEALSRPGPWPAPSRPPPRPRVSFRLPGVLYLPAVLTGNLLHSPFLPTHQTKGGSLPPQVCTEAPLPLGRVLRLPGSSPQQTRPFTSPLWLRRPLPVCPLPPVSTRRCPSYSRRSTKNCRLNAHTHK